MQTLNYEGVDYFVFDGVSDFAGEIQRSKKGILKTTFDGLKKDIPEIFQLLSNKFGADSREAHAVTEAKLFCGKCGAPFRSTTLTLVLVPYQSTRDFEGKCPKCSSTEVIYLFRS